MTKDNEDKPPADPPADEKSPEKGSENVPPAEDTNSPLVTAQNTVEEMKKQNSRMEANLKRQEKLVAEQMLQGRAGAGQPPAEKEETPQEYAKRAVAGGLNG